MTVPYHAGSRKLQDRFDTRRLADRLDEKFLSRPTIDAGDRAFIERMDMFFLATADADGRPQCSYKGGDPGFVRVLDERTVAFPNYDGNGMYLSMGNLLVNPHVGMLFIDFVSTRPSRLRPDCNVAARPTRTAEFDRRHFRLDASVDCCGKPSTGTGLTRAGAALIAVALVVELAGSVRAVVQSRGQGDAG